MALDFPSSPTTGQAFNSYVFDGEKWTLPTNSSQDFVRYGVQTLSAGQKTQALTNLGSSIAGNTGAFTLSRGITNSTNDIRLDVPAFYGFIGGLTLSSGGGSAIFSINPGAAVDSTGTDLMKLTSAYTKNTAAWAVGSGNGALDTGTIAANTWYHVHLIKRLDTNVVDVLVSLSATAPTLPTNYTIFRRIGSMRTVAGVVWVKFTQTEDHFLWADPVTDANAATINTTAALYTLSVPSGVKVMAKYRGYFAANNLNFLMSSPDENDNLPQTIAGNNTYFSVIGAGTTTVPFGEIQTLTNTSSQIRGRATGSANITIATYGWIDFRGK